MLPLSGFSRHHTFHTILAKYILYSWMVQTASVSADNLNMRVQSLPCLVMGFALVSKVAAVIQKPLRAYGTEVDALRPLLRREPLEDSASLFAEGSDGAAEPLSSATPSTMSPGTYAKGSPDSNNCSVGYENVISPEECKAALANFGCSDSTTDFINDDRDDRAKGCFMWVNGRYSS